MAVFPRTRDCLILVKGDAYPVTVSASLAQGGWQGGQGVQWAPNPGLDAPMVTYSTGYYAGFMLWGSDETGDDYTAMTRHQPAYRISVVGAGGWLISTRSFEKYTWASRQGGPLVPLVYVESDRLVFSLRGFFTSEDEFTLSGDPRAPNNYYIAYVAQAPSAATDGYLTLQTSI